MMYLKLADILDNVNKEHCIDFERLCFNGGENHIKITSHIIRHRRKVKHVLIEAQLKNSDYVMELLMATDALRRLGVETIDLLCPYIPYGRQDRVMVTGEPLSIKVFADIINMQNYKNVYTLDNHSSTTTALINNCIEISMLGVLDDYLPINMDYLVCPDTGAQKKLLKYAKAFNTEIIYGSKIRDTSTGEITETRIDKQDLNKKNCLIIDDICDGGRTFIELAKVLKKHNSGNIDLFVTHGIFAYGTQELHEHINKIYTLNCFRMPFDVKRFDITVYKLKKKHIKWLSNDERM